MDTYVYQPAFAVSTNGYVGIGKTNPTQKLDVAGMPWSQGM